MLKVMFDSAGQVNYSELTDETTVTDLVNAVESFLQEHPVPCDSCKKNCCKASWNINADNVFVKTNSQKDIIYFIQKSLIHKNYYFYIKKKNHCKFLNVFNKCDVYSSRPLVCRLYLCHPESERYKLLRNLIGHTFQAALTAEWLEAVERTDSMIKATEIFSVPNPAIYAKNYDIPIKLILENCKQVISSDEVVLFKTL